MPFPCSWLKHGSMSGEATKTSQTNVLLRLPTKFTERATMNMLEYKRNSNVPLYIYMPYRYVYIYICHMYMYIYICHMYIYMPYIYIYIRVYIYIHIYTNPMRLTSSTWRTFPPLHRCHLGYNLLLPPSYPSNLPPPLDGNAGKPLGPGSQQP